MSWLSQLTGIHLGNVGAPVGALLGSVVPGVGTALGAGLGQALGGIGSGKGVGPSLAQGAGVYAGGKLLGSALGALQGGGSANTDPNGGMADASTGGDGSQSWLQSLLHGAEGVGSTLLNGAKNAVSGSGPGGLSLPVLGLAGAQVANAAQLGAKGNDYADKAFNLSNDSYGSRAGLRSAGIAGLSTPRPMQDLSGLTAIRNRNPVAGGLRSATGA